MQKNSKRSNNSRVSHTDRNSVDAEKEKHESQNNFVDLLPEEISLKIFSQLDIQSLCRASLTCRSWNDTVILLRNYQKSKVKHEWLSGRYSNICSSISLPEKIMYPMDADTWGEILEAELER
ncbi:F-box only protein 48 [Aotus nancymaae]|uniref:F-box only protein 48 n=1 Tax=Aotus nancymaae TaxID=37293 RepID=UPI000626536C|nr:F-box only protein 48 [Aotus nancymaae]XP_012331011.1 F-box only protein 48 [Aotus nancymaae]XP_012331012.1 F-box only protein 48 [Aotus nancymaae]